MKYFVMIASLLSGAALLFYQMQVRDDSVTLDSSPAQVSSADLKRDWPDSLDPQEPFLWLNQAPLFPAQYQNARRQIRARSRDHRDAVIRLLVRMELMSQRVSNDQEYKSSPKDFPKPIAHESWFDFQERHYQARHLMMTQLSPKSKTQRATSSFTSESTHSPIKISLEGYSISLTGLNANQRESLTIELQSLEKKMKFRRLSWREIGRHLPERARRVLLTRAQLGSNEIDKELNAELTALTALTARDTLPVGTPLPILSTPSHLWWIRIQQLIRVESSLQVSRTEIGPSALKQLEDRISEDYENAEISISLSSLTDLARRRLTAHFSNPLPQRLPFQLP